MQSIWEQLTDINNDEEIIIKEFNKRYKDTILGYKPQTPLELKPTEYLYYKGSEENNFIFENQILGEEIIFPIEQNPYLFIPKLQKGFYETNKLFYVSYLPKRQWKRGLTSINYRIYNFLLLLTMQSIHKTNFFSIIPKCLTQNDNKIEKFNVDCFLSAQLNSYYLINRHFVITKSINSKKGYTLFFHNFAVGEFLNPNIFTCTNPIFLQEIKEAFEQWSFFPEFLN